MTLLKIIMTIMIMTITIIIVIITITWHGKEIQSNKQAFIPIGI